MSDPFNMFDPYSHNFDPRARRTMTTDSTQTLVLRDNPPEVVDALKVKVVQLDPTLPEPVYLTRHLLRCLGSCGEYIRKFNTHFPPSDVRWHWGAPMTQQVCVEYARHYDWEWAASTMLNWDGQRLVERLRTSRSAENRKFGTGRERRAAVFGHVIHTHPEYRSDQLQRALRQQVEQADEFALTDFREAEQSLLHTEESIGADKRRITEIQERIAASEERLPLLRAEVERQRVACREILSRVQQRKVEEATAEVKRVTTLLESVQQAAVIAAEELQRLRELKPDDDTTATAGTGDDA